MGIEIDNIKVAIFLRYSLLMYISDKAKTNEDKLQNQNNSNK
ncbi:MAG: hypothetical protein QM532_02915 [Cyanobium sp. MAG06]|nr:hypothetical protein [Cyanobium sp. MAG06]